MSFQAIITGDIVRSRNIDPLTREKLFLDTGLLLENLKDRYISRYETYRGDSLQCAALYPENALRVALIIRAFFRSYLPGDKKRVEKTKGYFSTEYDIRIAIGMGEIEFVNENKLTGSDGEAFRRSGDALEDLGAGTQRLAIKTADENFDDQMEPAILLLDALIQKWTQHQAQLVLFKLQDKKEDEIATLLGISQSAVNQRTKTAQWHAIEKMITQFEKTVKNWQP